MTAPLLVVALAAVGAALGGVRWLRVAQREHYLAGSCTRFALRWWRSSRQNQLLLALSLAGLVAGGALAGAGGGWLALLGALPAVGAAVGPVGLGLRGRTGPLRWTGRLGRSAAVWAVLQVIPLVVAALVGTPSAVVVALAGLDVLAVPCLVDAALALLAPAEAAAGRRWIRAAEQRLEAVRPEVVGITGSYGKTSTKGYVAHLLSGQFSVVATSVRNNNTAGLSRAVNEHLVPGTQVFVAEMGTYGPGEIAAMCAWAPPEVAVITAIGPVHLERMRTLERIADAKAEILERAPVAVLNVDHPLLARLADRAEAEGRTVWRCSASAGGADVSVRRQGDLLRVVVPRAGAGLDLVVGAGPEVEPGNVACALAVAFALGVPPEAVGARLATRVERRSLGGGERLVVLTMTRTAFSSTGAAIEHGEHCYRADRYSMEMTLMAR